MSTRDNKRWAEIERELAITLSTAQDAHVSLVLNEPHDQASAIDYDWHSILTEYLDDSEISELVTGLRDAGFAVTAFNGERDFLRSVLDGSWNAIRYPNKYVFNTTGSGIGRARTSLIPAFCDLSRIPICSSDGVTAALLENKFYTFRLLASLGFPVPTTQLFDLRYGWRDGTPEEGDLVICKPCFECSSIGVDESGVFHFESSKMKFIRDMAASFRQPVLVQEFVEGYEVEVPVFPCPAPVAPAAIGIKVGGERLLGATILSNATIVEGSYDFYDFSDHAPPIAGTLKETAENAYRSLGLSGLTRVDFRIDEEYRYCITDFNTPPHLTEHSSCRFAFTGAGMSHAQLMASVVTIGRLNSIGQKPDQI